MAIAQLFHCAVHVLESAFEFVSAISPIEGIAARQSNRRALFFIGCCAAFDPGHAALGQCMARFDTELTRFHNALTGVWGGVKSSDARAYAVRMLYGYSLHTRTHSISPVSISTQAFPFCS